MKILDILIGFLSSSAVWMIMVLMVSAAGLISPRETNIENMLMVLVAILLALTAYVVMIIDILTNKK